MNAEGAGGESPPKQQLLYDLHPLQENAPVKAMKLRKIKRPRR